MSKLVLPHGKGKLKPLLSGSDQRKEAIKKANTLKKVPMSTREISDVLMFSMGAYTPLDGFMNQSDWNKTCTDMKLQNDLF